MRPLLVASAVLSIMSLPVLAETVARADRKAQMEAAITACEAYLTEQGVNVTLPRPPQRPSEEQRSAITLCEENGILPARPPRGEFHHGSEHGRPMGPHPEQPDSQGIQ